MTNKQKYRAWSKLRCDWIYVWAFSKAQAEILVRRRVKAIIGKFDNEYKVEEVK